MSEKTPRSPIRYIWISIGASIITISLKTIAWLMTDSVGLLSDAMESIINLFAAVIALIALTIALRPPDRNHPFGHYKAEYFSSVIEGILILVAAVSIGYAAVERMINPQPIASISMGLVVSALATAVNLVTSIILMKAGKRYHSITLEADAHHLMTDVYTTAGVIAALILVHFTNWLWLDPVIAIGVAINIIFTGTKLIGRSVSGLMDEALPKDDLEIIHSILKQHTNSHVQYHAVYTRRASSRNFITFHLLVPGSWSVLQGHELTKLIEQELEKALPRSYVFIHLEPTGDPASFDDYLHE